MESEIKSRVDSAVPHPDAAQQLSEEEKRALEQSGEVEHTRGDHKAEVTQKPGAAEE